MMKLNTAPYEAKRSNVSERDCGGNICKIHSDNIGVKNPKIKRHFKWHETEVAFIACRPGSTVVAGDTSDPADINTPLADIAADLNTVRPVVAGGTGQASIASVQSSFGIAPVDAAAAISGDWTFTGAVNLTGATVTGAGISDGDKGDITVSSSGGVWSLNAGSVDAAEIASSAVSTTKLADTSVSTAKIVDDAVTAAKLADTSVTPGSYTASAITVDAQGRITAASTGASASWSLVENQTPSGGSVTTTGLSSYRSVRFELVVQEDGSSALYTVQARVSAGTWRTLGTFSGSGTSNTIMTVAGRIANFNNDDGNGRKGYILWGGAGTGTINPTNNEVVSGTAQAKIGTSFRAEVWDEIRVTTGGAMEGSGSFSVEGLGA